ncbi:hypothetical protein Rhe02_07570 [Rhizocola hellebori]|uniref:Uncharacterized protein n=1 Tax=Rhizocola hellebori TaxID=1392758 RepID=A0A8J3Q3R1_9ACTN|nr:hypothetical protein Rhe02_07570 [Rhizocola hellebori]
MHEVSDARSHRAVAKPIHRRWVTLLAALGVLIAGPTVILAQPAVAAPGPISWYCSQVTETPHESGGWIEFRGHLNCGDYMFNRVEMTVIAYRDGGIATRTKITCYYPTVGYCFGNLWLSDPGGNQRYCNYVSTWAWLKNGASGSFQGKSCEDWNTP